MTLLRVIRVGDLRGGEIELKCIGMSVLRIEAIQDQ